MDDHSEGPQAWPAREGRPALTFLLCARPQGRAGRIPPRRPARMDPRGAALF